MGYVNNDGNREITTACNFLQAFAIAAFSVERAFCFPCPYLVQNHNSRAEIQSLVSETIKFVFLLFIVTILLAIYATSSNIESDVH